MQIAIGCDDRETLPNFYLWMASCEAAICPGMGNDRERRPHDNALVKLLSSNS
jgi:hypothetical protein